MNPRTCLEVLPAVRSSSTRLATQQYLQSTSRHSAFPLPNAFTLTRCPTKSRFGFARSTAMKSAQSSKSVAYAIAFPKMLRYVPIIGMLANRDGCHPAGTSTDAMRGFPRGVSRSVMLALAGRISLGQKRDHSRCSRGVRRRQSNERPCSVSSGRLGIGSATVG